MHNSMTRRACFDNNLPLVSVIVPSYNHARYVEQCVISIMTQTYEHVELIVIDDGSTDCSVDILNRLRKLYDFQFVQHENRGCAATLNRGIVEFARGRYIAFCASDDYWMPTKLEKQIAYMESHPEVGLSFTKNYFVNEHDVVLEKLTEAANKNLRGGSIFKEILFQTIHPLPGYVIRKEVFDEVGLYREDIWTEDFHMNLKIASRYLIGFLDEYLSYYRYPVDFSKKLKSTRVADAHLLCIQEYRDSPYYEEALKRWHYRNLLWYSPSRYNKKYALRGLIEGSIFSFNEEFIKSLMKLIFVWRS